MSEETVVGCPFCGETPMQNRHVPCGTDRDWGDPRRRDLALEHQEGENARRYHAGGPASQITGERSESE